MSTLQTWTGSIATGLDQEISSDWSSEMMCSSVVDETNFSAIILERQDARWLQLFHKSGVCLCQGKVLDEEVKQQQEG
jgi:hypothetical protein